VIIKPHGWQALIEGMIEGVWIVDAIELRLLAVNRNAANLLGQPVAALLGRPVIELAATPEDIFFWEDAAAGLSDQICSETLLLRADGSTVPVERRVSRVVLANEGAVFVVGIHDQSEERRVEGELERLVAELRATLESSADGILTVDMDGAIRGYNQRFAEQWVLPQGLVTHRDDSAVYGWMAQQITDPEQYAARLAVIGRAPLLEATDILVLRSGTVLERVTLPQYARGRPIGRVYSFRDISRRLADQVQLQLAAKVFEASLDAIFVADAELLVVTANPACERLTGEALDGLLGTRVDKLLVGSPEDTHFTEKMRYELDSHGIWQGEAWHRTRDGRSLPCQVSLVRVADEQGQPMHYIGFFKDLTEAVSARKRIEQLAYTDSLTGLPNRIMLAERMELEINMASRENAEFALLFIDLDRFKHINDSLGHLFGDKVLIEVADRIRDCLRQVDTAARQGGDEFLLLLHRVDARGAEITAKRILERLSQPIRIDEMSFTVTCSIGIALYPGDGATMDDLVKNADAAMYHVKERGRSAFRFYQRQMNVGLLSRMKLDHAMREALSETVAGQGFRVHYQPQVDFHSNGIIGAEALLRWHHHELGEVSPAQFIPVAEETGVIIPIGEFVMREAVRQCAEWNARGFSLMIAVNVSALQFQQAGFVTSVAHILKESGLPPSLLELELTESILIQDVEETMKRLEALAALGVRLAIDDFGTGYSSLSYLKRFPIQKLKIDRSFVGDLPDDESDVAIVNAIIQMARALHLTTIAEGVETGVQHDFLVAAGCDEFQGFLCSPALDPIAFAELVVNRSLGQAARMDRFTAVPPAPPAQA
jgi:diguanylate cyclase (GGDEF)-like protein/PAS domain S-box-containing protein